MRATLIGTDEAGYGPNLGPLTIQGTLWKVAEPDVDLYEQLQSAVSRRDCDEALRLHIADSKQVHRTENLKFLELPVLAILQALIGEIPASLESLTQQLCSRSSAPSSGAPEPKQAWLHGEAISLPVAACRGEIERLSERFQLACERAHVRLLKTEGRVVFADQFNESLAWAGNKASLLSIHTLQIVHGLLNAGAPSTPSESKLVRIVCDKHGGRNKYAALLQEYLTPEFITIEREQLSTSVYRFREGDRHVSIEFTAKGETFLPAAVSSMIAKYIRELTMIGWNRFWQQYLPALKPTKGYPVDAKRFLQEIDGVREMQGIDLNSIWRTR